MAVVHDPGDARGYVLLAFLFGPAAVALVAAGIGAALVVAVVCLGLLLLLRFVLQGFAFWADVLGHARRY